MKLPFTDEQFLDVFRDYNQMVGAAALVLWVATAALAVVWLGSGRSRDRWIAFLLSVHWAWSGAVYHLMFFARINPAAWVFGALFLLQAVLFLWLGVVRSRLHFSSRQASPWAVASSVFVIYALIYPALAFAVGFRLPRMPTFGVPCPTTLLTAGFLLSTGPTSPRMLFVIPILWCVVGGSAAFLFGVYPDWALAVAGVALLVYGFKTRAVAGA